MSHTIVKPAVSPPSQDQGGRKKRDNGHDWPDPHLSAHQIMLYLQCSLRYWFEYIAKEPMLFLPAPLPFGKSVHEAVAAFLRSVQAGNLMTAQDTRQVFADSWINTLWDDPPILYDKEDYYALREKGKAMVSLFCKEYQPAPLILNVEEPFCVSLDNDLPPLVGIIDLVELDGENLDKLMVTDLKTASRKPNGSCKHQDIQLGLYVLAMRFQGWEHQEIQAQYVMLIKTQEPQFHVVSVEMPEGYGDWLVSLVKAVWDGISKGVFIPNPSYLCASCPYQGPCQKWRGTSNGADNGTSTIKEVSHALHR